MKPDAEVKALAVSEKVFRRLLAAYPQAHREDYGAAMVQLFRDQCRDAWHESRRWGLVKLWLRVLPDVVGTSFAEHLDAFKERKFMLNRITSLFRLAQSFKFFTVFTAVFLLVVITATIIAVSLPTRYYSEVMLFVRTDSEVPVSVLPGTKEFDNLMKAQWKALEVAMPHECGQIQSDAVLNEVIASLDLNTTWGDKKYGSGEKLKASEALDLLRKMIVVEVAHRSPVIHLRIYGYKPDEAVRIAEKLIQAYFNRHRQEKGFGKNGTDIWTIQLPSPAVVSRDKGRIIRFGVLYGFLLGALAAVSNSGVSFLRRQNSPPKIVT